MSKIRKFLSLVVFGVAIWSFNLFLLPRVSSDLEILSKSKKDLSIKQSFNDNSPADLSKSINQFVVKEFDKNQAINLIDALSKESGVVISSLDIQAISQVPNSSTVEDQSLDGNLDSLELVSGSNAVQSSTLKSVNLDLDITGSKNSIESFISRLDNSRQYIDIQDININFNNTLESASNEVDAQIKALIYYVKL
jgi:hypothetical protein